MAPYGATRPKREENESYDYSSFIWDPHFVIYSSLAIFFILGVIWIWLVQVSQNRPNTLRGRPKMSKKRTKKLEFFSVLHIKTFFRDKLANKSILDLDTLVKNTTSECNNFGFPRMKKLHTWRQKRASRCTFFAISVKSIRILLIHSEITYSH